MATLAAILDRRAGVYAKLSTTAAKTFADYLAGDKLREDEQILTEPVMQDLVEDLLGFPRDAYFPQYGRGGLKPDVTPDDLVAHPFVLDAKSSRQDLAAHETQIRAYIDQRRLSYGVLFNLHEIRVYRRGQKGHDRGLSFKLLPVWETARAEAMPGPEVAKLDAFCDLFQHHEVSFVDQVQRIRTSPSWVQLEAEGDELRIDLEYLVARLRRLSLMLAEDAASQYEALERALSLSPTRERSLLGELRMLALDISPGTSFDDLPEDVPGFRHARADELAGRSWKQYLVRVSQLALVRILLYRSWEDAQFVEERLYDGGFGDLYDRLDHSIQQVLREAFNAGRDRYRWLYGEDNNYDWYRPHDPAVVEVLYALAPVPLGKLDADVLGGLYESYVDDIDRDRLGQFYTPRSVVRFMLDRVGFESADRLFRIEGDDRKPLRILDFATGSGGFVTDAARRIVDAVEDGDVRDLDDGMAAIVRGIHGCEISPFPYYLTEVNLLLQVSRLLGKLRARGDEPGTFVLGVVHWDTLAARQASEESLAGLDPADRADRAELAEDERFSLVPLDAEKRDAFARMRQDEAFDLVVGNPPYVAEANNKVLFDRLRALPAWRDTFRGKSDYLYYFLWLAAEKLAAGGRLAVIVPAGWMNAGNADWLRRRLADVLTLDELFLFGSYRLFAPEPEGRDDGRRAPTPTVESAILIATKGRASGRHHLRVAALEDPVAAAAAFGQQVDHVPDRTRLLEAMAKRIGGRPGRTRGIHVHRVRQANLVADRPWPVKHAARDLAARVVAVLDRFVESNDHPVELLSRRWDVFRGVETGADAYTKRLQKALSPQARQQLENSGKLLGDRIMELREGEVRAEPWISHPELLGKSPEARAILYGAIDDSDVSYLVMTKRDPQPPADVLAALDPWRPVLSNRAEVKRNQNRAWWETLWPRDADAMARPKVIALYRTDRGRFAIDESGALKPSNKATVCTPKEQGLSVAYLCGLLNSELLDLWYAVRGKTPWHVRRNYEPKPMRRMPYRHVELPHSEPEPIRRVREALHESRIEDAVTGCLAVADELSHSGQNVSEAAAALETLVRGIAANRRSLLPYRAVAPALARVVKDPWNSGPVKIEPAAVVQTMPSSARASARTDPTLTVTVHRDGAIGRGSLEGGKLVFRHSRKITAEVTGPERRLAFVLLSARDPKMLSEDLKQVPLPKQMSELEKLLDVRAAEIDGILQSGRRLVEAAERLVCRLYGVSREIEDAVIAHAIERAGSRMPDADEPEA